MRKKDVAAYATVVDVLRSIRDDDGGHEADDVWQLFLAICLLGSPKYRQMCTYGMPFTGTWAIRQTPAALEEWEMRKWRWLRLRSHFRVLLVYWWLPTGLNG